MKKYIVLIACSIALLTQSCGDEHQFWPHVAPATNDAAKVKFVHAASDTVGVNLFFGDTKVTGNAPSKITTIGSVNFDKVNVGTVTFQNAFPVTNYTGVSASSGTLSVVFPESYNATTTFNMKTMSTTDASLTPGAFYTIAFVGVSQAYETVVISDDLSSAPIDGKAYVRFANFIHNAPASLNLVATPPATVDDPAPVPVVIAQNIAYKDVSGFIALPRTGTFTNIQVTNSATNAVITTLAATSAAFADNKVYTVFARGRVGGAGTAAPGATRIINR